MNTLQQIPAERVELRPIRPEDIAQIAVIERLCFPDPWSEGALRLFLCEDGYAVVLCQDARVMAYGGLLWSVDEGQIINIAVSPDSRRMGYGRRVMEALIEEAARRGCAQMSLEVRASNTPAISLYEQLGFETAGRRKNFYTHPTEDAFVMLKQLEQKVD